MNVYFKFSLVLTFICWPVFLVNCQPVPEEKLSQFNLRVDKDISGDTLTYSIYNDLHTPMRLTINPRNEATKDLMSEVVKINLAAKTDTHLVYITDLTEEEISAGISATFGDPSIPVKLDTLLFPFPKDRSYKIIQGYNGEFSHKGDYSRYAVDFSHAIGDTITAVADGFVVGVIKDYEYGGSNQKWRDYANFLTLYHPQMNIYTQYVHLIKDGALVSVGDTVSAGQPIALSGLTGWTTVEHLHFNALKPSATGIKGVQVVFEGGITGASLKRGDVVSRKK